MNNFNEGACKFIGAFQINSDDELNWSTGPILSVTRLIGPSRYAIVLSPGNGSSRFVISATYIGQQPTVIPYMSTSTPGTILGTPENPLDVVAESASSALNVTIHEIILT